MFNPIRRQITDRVVITVDCNCCGTDHEIPATLKQWYDFAILGELVQDAFPSMPKEHRELLVSGTCSNCFDRIAHCHLG